jgi:phospholipid/cholesterol/gamma-HCH transport system substrate-binding protein
LRIDPQFNDIPEDSDASIQTQGLLGGKYVGISPGGSDMFLKDGSDITFTQSAIVLESLVNKFFANFASRGDDSGANNNGAGESKTPGGNDSGGDAGKEKQK